MPTDHSSLSKTHSKSSSGGSRPSFFGRASGFVMGYRRSQAASESQAGTSSSATDSSASGSRAAGTASGMHNFEHVFSAPDPSVKLAPPAPLSEEQEKKYLEMLQHFKSIDKYPTALKPNSKKEPLTEWEKLRMLSRESMIRYLRATKWDVASAKRRLTDTISWRREFGVDSLKAADLEPEAVTGKESLLGFDNKGRPLHYMHPSRNTTKETPRQMQFAVWMLERAIDIMPPGVEMLALLINFGGKKSNPTSIGNAKLMLYILQNHYVERLGIALCINVPWIFKAFWNAIYPFIDPVTKAKCKFDEAIKDEVPGPQLASDFGGLLNFQYEHDKYWPQLIALADKRREEQLERFRKNFNSEIGASEWVIRGGDELNQSVKASKEDSGYHEGEAESNRTGSTVVDGQAPIHEASPSEDNDGGLDRFYTSQQEIGLQPVNTTSDLATKYVVEKETPTVDVEESHTAHVHKHGDASLFAAVVGGVSAGLVGGKVASDVSSQARKSADKESELHDKHNHIKHAKALANRRSQSPHTAPAISAV